MALETLEELQRSYEKAVQAANDWKTRRARSGLSSVKQQQEMLRLEGEVKRALQGLKLAKKGTLANQIKGMRMKGIQTKASRLSGKPRGKTGIAARPQVGGSVAGNVADIENNVSGARGNSAAGNGASGAPVNGAPGNGAPGNGAQGNGAPPEQHEPIQTGMVNATAHNNAVSYPITGGSGSGESSTIPKNVAQPKKNGNVATSGYARPDSLIPSASSAGNRDRNQPVNTGPLPLEYPLDLSDINNIEEEDRSNRLLPKFRPFRLPTKRPREKDALETSLQNDKPEINWFGDPVTRPKPQPAFNPDALRSLKAKVHANPSVSQKSSTDKQRTPDPAPPAFSNDEWTRLTGVIMKEDQANKFLPKFQAPLLPDKRPREEVTKRPPKPSPTNNLEEANVPLPPPSSLEMPPRRARNDRRTASFVNGHLPPPSSLELPPRRVRNHTRAASFVNGHLPPPSSLDQPSRRVRNGRRAASFANVPLPPPSSLELPPRRVRNNTRATSFANVHNVLLPPTRDLQLPSRRARNDRRAASFVNVPLPPPSSLELPSTRAHTETKNAFASSFPNRITQTDPARDDPFVKGLPFTLPGRRVRSQNLAHVRAEDTEAPSAMMVNAERHLPAVPTHTPAPIQTINVHKAVELPSARGSDAPTRVGKPAERRRPLAKPKKEPQRQPKQPVPISVKASAVGPHVSQGSRSEHVVATKPKSTTSWWPWGKSLPDTKHTGLNQKAYEKALQDHKKTILHEIEKVRGTARGTAAEGISAGGSPSGGTSKEWNKALQLQKATLMKEIGKLKEEPKSKESWWPWGKPSPGTQRVPTGLNQKAYEKALKDHKNSILQEIEKVRPHVPAGGTSAPAGGTSKEWNKVLQAQKDTLIKEIGKLKEEPKSSGSWWPWRKPSYAGQNVGKIEKVKEARGTTPVGLNTAIAVEKATLTNEIQRLMKEQKASEQTAESRRLSEVYSTLLEKREALRKANLAERRSSNMGSRGEKRVGEAQKATPMNEIRRLTRKIEERKPREATARDAKVAGTKVPEVRRGWDRYSANDKRSLQYARQREFKRLVEIEKALIPRKRAAIAALDKVLSRLT